MRIRYVPTECSKVNKIFKSISKLSTISILFNQKVTLNCEFKLKY